MIKPELLAPAGSYESIYPAVRMGADAVYLGATCFSARGNAGNFDELQLTSAVSYCHAHDVKVYLTLNTTLHDDELEKSAELIRKITEIGVDAVIVQDMGVARLIREISPQLRLHASTQMTIHTPAGAKALYSAGFSRVVLARELTKDEIIYIVNSCPIETEVFVHGALCMCVSGQCYFSAMLGSRSGNRGLCAQPCRLPFAVNGIRGNALSLKDQSLIGHIDELTEIGVTSLKIEGRMKRPEYVASAVKACRQALDTGKADENTLKQLEAVFSRQGFTDGYFTGKRGKPMFGIRTKENVVSATEEIFASIRAEYKDEKPKFPIYMNISINRDKPMTLAVTDDKGNTVTVCGDVPQTAINSPINEDKCRKSLEKTGGTPYCCVEIKCNIDAGLAVAASQLNKLRRDALEMLDAKRLTKTDRIINNVSLPQITPHEAQTPKLRAIFKSADIPAEFAVCEYVFVPYNTSTERLEQLRKIGINVALELPRAMFSAEDRIYKALVNAKNIGIHDVLAHTIGAAALAKQLDMTIHGGFGLNITNTQSLQWAEEYGLQDVQLSPELNVEQIQKLGGKIKRGVGVYGYMPLMITRNCPAKSARIECDSCKKQSYLTDRRGASQRLVCNGITTEVLNAVPTVMTDRLHELKNVDFHTLEFYVENNVETVEILSSYQAKKNVEEKYTRGLFYRGVL